MSDLDDFRSEFNIYFRDASDGILSTTQEDFLFNRAVRKLFGHQRLVLPEFNIATDTISEVAGTQEYAIFASSDLISVRRVHRLLPNEYDLESTELANAEQYSEQDRFYLIGKAIGLTREVSSTRANSIKLWGDVYPSLLADSTAETLTGLHHSFKDIVPLQTAVYALMTEGATDKTRYNSTVQQLSERIADAVNSAAQYNAVPKALEPTDFGGGVL